MQLNAEPTFQVAMLLGSPRSGTTWLAKIVDSDPNVLYRHEPDSINISLDTPFVPEVEQWEENAGKSREYLTRILNERACKSSGSQPMFGKAYRKLPSEKVRRGIIYGIKLSERFLGNKTLLSRIQIPDMLDISSTGNPLVFIKSVSSLCRAYMFSRACPQMKFIHILRHPCAYVASTVRGKKLGLLSDDAYIETLANMSGATAYGLTLDRLRSMSREEQLAARWMLQNEKVLMEMEGNSNYKRVIYEDLCGNPLRVTEDLFAFLCLSITDQTRTFIAQSSVGKTNEERYFDVKRDSAKAATGWMSELSAAQIDSIYDVVAGSSVGRLFFPC